LPLLIKIFVLAVVQGLCELLPVSSSAHVIMAEKAMGLDPTAPEMTFLLVMLHTGTMLAVIFYFWKSWRSRYFASAAAFWSSAGSLAVATLCTAVLGYGLVFLIEHVILRGAAKADVEQLFGNLTLIAVALASVGILIIVSGLRSATLRQRPLLGLADAVAIGTVQGLCLPFRGFSRSGATISTGLLRGVDKTALENFSFALAVILTPPAIAREAYRLFGKHAATGAGADIAALVWPSLAGMLLSFAAGWLSLKWLSQWLENGRWHLFGYYCLFAALCVFTVGLVQGS
jgi:undecaprenyl-diphosphatase